MTDYNINIKAKDLTGKAFGGVNSGLDSIKSKGLGLKTVFGIAGSAIAAFGAVKGIQNQIDAMDDLKAASEDFDEQDQKSNIGRRFEETQWGMFKMMVSLIFGGTGLSLLYVMYL